MLKNYLVIFMFLLLTNCGVPGSALLGPAFTGATTKSLAQTSLSFGTSQIVNITKEAKKKSKEKVIKITKKIDDLNLEISSGDFYASVKNLYFQEKKKRELFLFHR